MEKRGRSHVIPVDDLIAHKTDDDCECMPTTEDFLVIHNALDNREFDEIAATLEEKN